MSQDDPGTPKACQTPPTPGNGAPPFKRIVGEEPVTPATTVLQPDTTTSKQPGTMTAAQANLIQIACNGVNGNNVEGDDSRENSTAHTQQIGASYCA